MKEQLSEKDKDFKDLSEKFAREKEALYYHYGSLNTKYEALLHDQSKERV